MTAVPIFTVEIFFTIPIWFAMMDLMKMKLCVEVGNLFLIAYFFHLYSCNFDLATSFTLYTYVLGVSLCKNQEMGLHGIKTLLLTFYLIISKIRIKEKHDVPYHFG